MANANIDLYNFYRRYRWTETDFEGWQTGMVDLSRGMFEGLFGGGVLQGYEVTSGAGLSVNVAAGLAAGPSGYFNVTDATSNVSIASATGTIRRDLIVVRPSLVDGNYITEPTNPLASVPLTTAQESTIVVIQGVESNSPTYPATEANDVVLAGVRVKLGQASIATTDLDFEVRDVLGRNSNFQQDAGRFDDRLRPYISSNTTLGIKPSQLGSPFARVFTYVNRTRPSIFPKSGSSFVNADTFVNFQTGAITGGDATTPDFTPTIPTAGNSINCTVAIDTNDQISITYGTQGTRAQCLAGIINQPQSGAGSVLVTSNTKPVAFVTITSQNGSTVNEIEIADARGVNGIGEFSAGLAGAGTG
jgi:hypothetical protein